jgi:hypothetical protein
MISDRRLPGTEHDDAVMGLMTRKATAFWRYAGNFLLTSPLPNFKLKNAICRLKCS